MSDRPKLAALADRYGILPEYTDLGGVCQVTSDATRERLLSAFGVDASSEASAEAELVRLASEEAASIFNPVEVRARHGCDWTIQARIPHECSGAIEWHAEFTCASGGSIVQDGRLALSTPGGGRTLAIPIPDDLEEGYHEVALRIAHGSEQREARQLLIVTPLRCLTLDESIGPGRAVGVWTNLYSVQSETNWGVGDLADLREIVSKAGALGADFVGINPLHAMANRGNGVSPYSPVSRLFRNPIYIDIGAVPELAESDGAKALLNSVEFQEELDAVRRSSRIYYERIINLKLRVLRLLYDAFVEREAKGPTPRGDACREFIARHGEPLRSFAAFMASGESVASEAERSAPPVQRPPATDARTSSSADDVGFQCFLQFEIDRQLSDAQAAAKDAGMRLGIYNDLAIGAVGDGSDAASYPGLFVPGIEVGAPPDAYSAVGQKWGFPPIDPHQLRATGYDYWIRVLRSSMAHVGLLRIDHVMGLFRQFWVPKESDAREGAYVRYPAEDLLGILALESRPNETVIVGEDLGTVPPEVPDAMRRRGMLSTRLMVFEREWDGSFRSPSAYPREALVMASNHDYPPLPGLLAERDIQVRLAHGLFTEQQAEEERGALGHLRECLMRALCDAGFDADSDAASPEKLCRWVYEFLARTPCRLLGVSLDDLAGEHEPINLPGVPPSKFPSWTRRMDMPLSGVLNDGIFRDVLRLVGQTA